jgi:hypothetical protein
LKANAIVQKEGVQDKKESAEKLPGLIMQGG